jgi:hypothetical protein
VRAYTFRKTGADDVRLTMAPSVPQINPVFVINGWHAPAATVAVDGKPLAADKVRMQVSGEDLVVWVEGVFSQETAFAFTP